MMFQVWPCHRCVLQYWQFSIPFFFLKISGMKFAVLIVMAHLSWFFLKKIELATMVLCWFISGWCVYKVETFTPDIHNFYSKSPLPTSRAFWSSSSRLEILLSFLTTFLLTLILYNLWLNLTTFPTTALCPPHCIVCPLFLSSASCFITRYWSINDHALYDQ